MLDLNPGDNQDIRYELAGCLLDEEMDEELGELLERYEEDASAFWVYTRALWGLPGALPEFIGFGDESEAVTYFARALTGWLRTPQAVGWLRQNVDERLLAEIEEK